jgi:PAS domain S-box-containing protein
MDMSVPPDSAAALRPEPGAPPADAWFRSVVEAANEGIWIIDLEARTLFANQRMATMLGTTPAGLGDRTPFDFLSDEDRLHGADVMARNFEGTPVQFEIRFRRDDGSVIPVLGGTAPLRDQQGAIIGSVGTFSDLTDRQASQKAIAASERQARETATLFLKLLESSSDAIWMRDPEGRFQLANPPAARVLGGKSDPADIIGKPMADLWGTEFAALLQAQTDALFARGKSETVEEHVFDSSRQRPAVFLSTKVPLYNDDGSWLGVLGVSRDITDIKRVEDDLRQSEARLAEQVAEMTALYNSAPIGLAFFDREYRYLRINDELAAINGVPAEAHIGRTIRDVLADNAPQVEPIIDRVFASGEPVRDLEVSGETPQQLGVLRHWLTGFYPVKDDVGAVAAVGIWVVEISERKAAEQREHLLAREVDHRSKNLLAVVQSVVQLSRATSVDELKEGLTGRIQALARAHSLLADARWEGVDLAQLVEEELAPFVGTDSGRLNYSGPPVMLRPASAQSLALVLHELTTNAAKYGALSAARGTLSLRWELAESGGSENLVLHWVESGGTNVQAPSESGFGSRLITTSIDRQLRGKVERDWTAEGLRCTIRIPVENAVVTV